MARGVRAEEFDAGEWRSGSREGGGFEELASFHVGRFSFGFRLFGRAFRTCGLDGSFVELAKSLKPGFMKANSKHQRRAGDALRGQFETDMRRADLLQALLHDTKRQRGPVAVAAQVTKI